MSLPKASNKTRILFVSVVARLGGAERSLLDLLDEIDRRCFDPFVALPGEGELQDALEARSIPIFTVPLERFHRTLNPIRLANYSAAWNAGCQALSTIVQQQSIELIHSNGDIAQLYAYSVACSEDVPLIWHVRDLTPLKWLRPRLAKNATRVVAISSAVRSMLLDSGVPGKKIQVVLNGIDTSPFESVPTPLTAEPVVGMVSHLYPWKGHKDFLHAAALVREAIPETGFVIAGDDLFNDQPEYRDELESLGAELGLEDSVEFLGNCEDVPAALARMHVLAVPSHGEPFGRNVVEAMAAGRPVVAWDLAGPSEILDNGETGILVSPYEVEAFAGSIIELLRNREKLESMGERGRAVARERFHRSRTASEVQAIYRELCP